MDLFNYDGNRGELIKYIDSIKDSAQRELALAEYCYFTGNHEKAASLVAKYITSPDSTIKATAILYYSFSNLALCKPDEVNQGIEFCKSLLSAEAVGKEMRAMAVLIANAGNVLIDLQLKGVPSLNEYLSALSGGYRVFGCYIMAHDAYLKGDYNKGLGIVETCLSLEGTKYLIPLIYLYLVGAMNAMSIGNVSLGKAYFNKAFECAKPDGLFEPLGEHHGLLQGLVETCLKKEGKSDYEKIIAITYRFSFGWRCIHNPITNEKIADTLTTIEFTVAMLANRGWTNTEIADYLGLNINTIKSHITSIFNKLNINSRKELKGFMLK